MSYLVLSVRPYSFDADDGRHISGASVTYLDTSSVSHEGAAPLTISVPPEVAPRFPKAPAIYDLHFEQRRGKGGKPVLALKGAELVRPIDLSTL